MEDPNPKVSGRGLTTLTEAGIEVGCLEQEALELNRRFFFAMTSLLGSRSNGPKAVTVLWTPMNARRMARRTP